MSILYKIFAVLLAHAFYSTSAFAAIETFNAPDRDTITNFRSDWINASGIAPDHLVDFENGFVDAQNISGLGGLFPAGLVISDSSGAGIARIEATNGGIGGSDPVGGFSLEHNEQQYLVLDFSANPISMLGLQDIDHTGTNFRITHIDNSISTFSIEGTRVNGNSAEFIGIFINDMPAISRVEMDASGDGSWGIDNIEYSIAVVPVPGALVMFAPALLLLRRRHG